MSELKEYKGRSYEILFGSDIQRDCVYLELSDRTKEPFEVLAEIIHYDEIGKVVFSCYKEEIPYLTCPISGQKSLTMNGFNF